jgi:cytochrome c biogenesis protein
MRESPAEPMRYLRVPVDRDDSLGDFVLLRAALADPALRALAVERYAESAVEGGRGSLSDALQGSAARALDLFAGVERIDIPGNASMPAQPARGGLPSVSAFLETNVPAAERERASDVLVRILNGTLFELMQIARERRGLAPLPRDETTQTFMTNTVLSLSDAFYYPAPVTFKLQDFEHVQASVFQVARAPGQNIVYLGCLLLILGVFAMLYVRERRIWVWLAPTVDGRSQASMALSSNRKTMESDQEFDVLKTKLLKVPA